MASLQPLGGDRWRVRLRVGSPARGTDRQVSRTFTARGIRSAREKAPIVEAELRAELDVPENVDSVAGLVADWRSVHLAELSPSTVTSYEARLPRILDRWGQALASDISPRDLTRWYTELVAAGVSTSEVGKIHSVLSSLMTWAEQQDAVRQAPTRLAKRPRHRHRPITPPTTDRLVDVLAAAVGESGRAFRLCAYMGLRRGECVGLRWDDIGEGVALVQRSVLDRPGGAVLVKTPKSGAQRTVSLSRQAVEALVEQRQFVEAIGPTPWVFPSWRKDPTGQTPRRADWLSQRWAKHRARVGADDIRLHDLRHWFATQLIASGVAITDVSAELGHAQTSTTLAIYAHASDTRHDRVRAALDGIGAQSL